MFKEIAWKNFEKTGDLESFFEYKKIDELMRKVDLENITGEGINEFDESKGDNNQRNPL